MRQAEWIVLPTASSGGLTVSYPLERPLNLLDPPLIVLTSPRIVRRAAATPIDGVFEAVNTGYCRLMALQGLTGKSTSSTTRTPVHPGRKRLGLAVAMVMFGSFMPWLNTEVGNLNGAGGPGIWTFYAAMLGLAGALIPLRRLGALQGAIVAAVAIALPVWQLARMVDLVGMGGWMPGPGIVLVFGGGVLASVAAVQLYREPTP